MNDITESSQMATSTTVVLISIIILIVLIVIAYFVITYVIPANQLRINSGDAILAAILILVGLFVIGLLIYHYITELSSSSVSSRADSDELGHNADIMLLTCMDFRFLDRITRFMDSKGWRDNYDHFVLAGASLGLSPELKSEVRPWQRTFWQHLQLASELHRITTVVILDHEDCGAYRELINFDNEAEDLENPDIIPISEREIHSKYLRQAYHTIRSRYPDLQVELYMIGLRQDTIQIQP